MARVILNAGHGGSDSGGTYMGRMEKDDNLRMAAAIGDILSKNGIEVYYTRVSDEFISPVARVKEINQLGGDLLVDIHRGFPTPEHFSGVRAFLDHEDGTPETAAENVLNNLQKLGFHNYGVSIRERNYLLEYSEVPGFLIDIGYIDSDFDNHMYDVHFYEIANVVAKGIIDTLKQNNLNR